MYTCTWIVECGRTLQNPRVLYFPLLLSHLLLILILKVAFNGFLGRWVTPGTVGGLFFL